MTDLDALGERTVTVDCDVLEADGGTRTVSITAMLELARSGIAELTAIQQEALGRHWPFR